MRKQALAEGLHVDAVEAVFGGVVLEDDDAAGVGANHDIVLKSDESIY